MLAKEAISQAIYRNKGNLTKDNSFYITEASDCKENYDAMSSKDKNPLVESKTSVTSKQSRCLIGITKNPPTLDITHALSSIVSDFVENLAYILYDNINLDNYDNLEFHFAKELLKASLSNKSFTEVIKNSYNLEAMLKFSDALTYSRQYTYENFLKTRFYPFWREMIDWNVYSNSLVKESILSTHFSNRRHSQTTEVINWMNEINFCNLKNDVIEQPLVPALDFVKRNSNKNKKLILLCVLTNENIHEETISSFNKMRNDDDIRMILPKPWHNVVVAHKALTISDENNQHITIFFRNPMEVKFRYEDSNFFSRREFKFNNSVEETNVFKDRVQTGRIRKIDSLQRQTTVVNQNIESCNRHDDKKLRKSPKQVGKKFENDAFLYLQEPILLNYIERNKTKQVLMYKTHSAENVSKDESKNNFLKILEELLAKSVEYKGEPIYFVFEPLKLITQLKKQTSDSKIVHHMKHKCDLIGSRIYKKLLQYEKIQKSRNANYENKTFRTMLTENEFQEKSTSEMQGKSVVSTQNCLDLPKNFSTSLTEKKFDINECTAQGDHSSKMPGKPITTTFTCLDLPRNCNCFNLQNNFSTPLTKNLFDMNECTMQGEYTKEMSDKPITRMHSCLDISKNYSCLNLPENFSTSVARKKIYVDELFPGYDSKLKSGRRIGRTALKQVNVRQIVSSVFKHFFHFYSLHGGNLRSGAVITRSNSNHWLQVAGIATDSCTLRLAGDIFTTVAGRKVVLNIFDYIKFLVTFARSRGLIVAELVKQMMVCEQLSELEYGMESCKKCETLGNPKNEPEEFHYENHLPISQSLPNFCSTNFKIMLPRASSSVGHTKYLNQEIV